MKNNEMHSIIFRYVWWTGTEIALEGAVGAEVVMEAQVEGNDGLL